MLCSSSLIFLAAAPSVFAASLWTGPDVTLLGAPSPDGDWLSFANAANGALSVRNLKTGTSRDIVVPAAGSKEFAYFSVFSRDAKHIAYAWFNGQGFYELRVAAVEGNAQPRTLYRNEIAGFVQPCSWTPDGSSILTLLFRKDNISQIALIPAAGGPPRVLRSLNWVYPKKMDISPDGRWIVYDNFAAENSAARAVFLLSMDGSKEVRLTPESGNYLFPLWSPDGRKIYFAGDEGGRQEIWSVDMAEGRAAGEPHVVATAPGRILPLGLTSGNDLIYGLRTGRTDIFMGEAGDPVPTRYAGRNSAPALAADGRYLAYLSRRGTENFGQDARVIVVQDLKTREEREVTAAMAHIERIAWSPDGTLLLAAGSDGKGRGGLFLVRAADGATRPFAAEPGGPARGFEGVWSKDGQSVYYLHSADELRVRQLGDGTETTFLRATAMKGLRISPAGDMLAIGIGGTAVRLTPLSGDGPARLIPFTGPRDLPWAGELRGLPFAAGSERSEVRAMHLP